MSFASEVAVVVAMVYHGAAARIWWPANSQVRWRRCGPGVHGLGALGEVARCVSFCFFLFLFFLSWPRDNLSTPHPRI